MIEDEIIDEMLANLIELKKDDFKVFFKSYKNMPFEIYLEIERLATSKSITNKERCINAKEVSNAFHKSIK